MIEASSTGLLVQSPTKTQIATITLFAFIGNIVAQTTRYFPGGFYFTFIENKGLNKNIGAVAISSVRITSAITPFLLKFIPHGITLTLKIRCFLIFLLNFLFVVPMSLIDNALQWDTEGWGAITLIFLCRSLQGFPAASIFLMVQGEIVDLYLSKYKVLILVISSSIHLACVVSTVTATELYLAGGWFATGLGIAAFNILPLVTLPLLLKVQRTIQQEANPTRQQTFQDTQADLGPIQEMNDRDVGSYQDQVTPNTKLQDKKNPVNKMSRLQTFAFFMPDIATFLNNIVFMIIRYSLPTRMVKFKGQVLDDAVLYSNQLELFAFLSTLVLGGITERKGDVFSLMIVGNVIYYVGSVLSFGCTTDMLSFFPAQLEVGSLLMGFGDASIMNLCIMSKFVLVEKIELEPESDLGSWSSAVFNASLNLSGALGIAVTGLTLSRESEIPVFLLMLVLSVVTTAGLVLMKNA